LPSLFAHTQYVVDRVDHDFLLRVGALTRSGESEHLAPCRGTSTPWSVSQVSCLGRNSLKCYGNIWVIVSQAYSLQNTTDGRPFGYMRLGDVIMCGTYVTKTRTTNSRSLSRQTVTGRCPGIVTRCHRSLRSSLASAPSVSLLPTLLKRAPLPTHTSLLILLEPFILLIHSYPTTIQETKPNQTK
jgi:hypothetical protein